MNSDLISRTELKEAIRKLPEWNGDDSYYSGVNDVSRLIDEASPAALESAQWIFADEWIPSSPDGPAECQWAGWICSNCGSFPTDNADWDDPQEPPKLKFCPNCGSPMTVCQIVLDGTEMPIIADLESGEGES